MAGLCYSNNYMIGIVLPTRGLVFSQVLEAIEREREGQNVKLYLSHDLSIPDGHNQLVKEALLDGCEHIWLIEEDTIPPPGALKRLYSAKKDIACIDYAVSGWGCVTRNQNNEILWCGLGCTMVKRKVFEAMEYPYFRVDKSLRLNDWRWIDLPKDYLDNKNYGSLDIWFCTQARRLGFTIHQMEGECVHLELKRLGKRGANHGLHLIENRPRIINKQILNNELERG